MASKRWVVSRDAGAQLQRYNSFSSSQRARLQHIWFPPVTDGRKFISLSTKRYYSSLQLDDAAGSSRFQYLDIFPNEQRQNAQFAVRWHPREDRLEWSLRRTPGALRPASNCYHSRHQVPRDFLRPNKCGDICFAW